MRSRILFAAIAALVVSSGCSTDAASERSPSPLGEELGLRTKDRELIRSAEMRIEREDPKSGVPRAVEVATQFGGYAQRSSDEYARLMIPSARLEEAMKALGGLGKVAQQHVHAQDVTEARADLALRVDNLKRTRERYLQLLERAETVTDTLAIERELERLTLELERYSAQLENVDSRIQLASVDVAFEKPFRPGPIGWVFYGLFTGVKWLFVWN